MKKFSLYIIVCVLGFSCSNSPKSSQKKLLIFSAASLTGVISELTKQYEQEHDIEIQLNVASSGTLARQIEHGAQPSIYISANEKWVDYLLGSKLIVPGSKQKLATNSMVLIVPKNSPIAELSFTNDFPASFKGRLAIGNPKHVPAGDYAWQAIQNAGYANDLEERILPTKDVRSALIVVELGEVEMGIVYLTDALKSEKVKIVGEVPAELHSDIEIFASTLTANNNKQTQLFYNFLGSKKAKSIWVKHGFKIE